MDPTKAAEALGSGTAQVILAVVLVCVTLVAIYLGKKLYESLAAQIEGGRADMAAQLRSNQMMSDALKEVRTGLDITNRILERALDARSKAA